MQPVELAITLLIVLLLLASVAVFRRQQGRSRRGRALRELLDGADALEAQLLDYRARMQGLKQLLTRLPQQLGASAISRLDAEAQVQQALRDVLAHRLWIKRESGTATQDALDSAVDALARSRRQLSEQLQLLDEVSAQLAVAGDELRAAFQEVSAARSAVARVLPRATESPDDAPPPPPTLH